MKINKPSTDKEIVMKPGTILVSKTDLKGIITYCNRDFIEMSGFSYPELMGNNHNLVRHPAMSPSVFVNLWDTIKAGEPWTGIIKNRSKSGDYYWVKANISPLYEGGEIVEYISVRTSPTREEIESAEALYAAINAGTASLAPEGIEKVTRFFETIKASAMVTGMMLVIVASMAAIAIAITKGVDTQLVMSALGFTAVISVIFGFFINSHVLNPLVDMETTLNQLAAGNYFNWINISPRNDQIGKLIRSIKSAQIRLGFEVMDAREQAAAASRMKTALDAVEANVMVTDPEYNIIYTNASLQKTFKDAEAEIQQQFPDFKADKLMGKNIDSFYIDPAHQRKIWGELRDKLSIELEIGGRVFKIITKPILEGNGPRLGTTVEWIDLTLERQFEFEKAIALEKERITAIENSQIKIALDNVSTGVMLADNDRNIIYMNKEVSHLFSAAADDIRKDLPDFDIDNLIGTNIDQFHKNPDYQINLIDAMDTSHRAEIVVGGHTMALITNPVIDNDGERICTAVEWRDRSAEVRVENEIDDLVNGAMAGNLDTRLVIDNKTGFIQELSLGINEFVDVVENVVADIANVMRATVAGDLSKRMQGSYAGSFESLRLDIDATTNKLGEIITGLRESTEQIMTGSQEIAAGNNSLSSRTEQQAAALQETAASMEEMTATVSINADNAQQANQVSKNARQLAEKGGEVVSEAIQAMTEINKSSMQISEIIGVIDDIAFQTSLLALNASVEAARAGEQGRGFAVVATEVRNLASRSAEAAKEIKELIQDSVNKVEAGSALVNQSSLTLNEIVGAVKKVGGIIAEIATASKEQSYGITQVSQAISSMEEVTQQNSALAEQTSAASSNMEQSSGEMDKLMDFFTVGSMRTKRSVSVAKERSVSAENKPKAKKPKAGRGSPVIEKVAAVVSPNAAEWEEF